MIEGHHEPLISKKLFLEVNKIREEKRVHGFVYDNENENLPLKIFTKCDKCKNTMTGYLVKKKTCTIINATQKVARSIGVLKRCTNYLLTCSNLFR